MNMPLTQNLQEFDPLPESWTERIFMRLHGRFGNPFLDKYRAGKLNAAGDDVGVENAKKVWAEELAGYSPDDIKRGLVKQFTFPPSCDEFKSACRPPIDTRTEWVEACEQMRIRLQGNQRDSWSRPEVYWAALSIGQFDLNNLSWEQIKTRWANAIANAKTDAIPEYCAQLPAPGKIAPTAEQIEKHVKELIARLGTEKRDYKAWARAIVENPKKYPSASLKLAQEALLAVA
jgi:hypothetical protein